MRAGRAARAIRAARSVPVREIPAVLAALVAAIGVEIGLRTMRLPRLAKLCGAPLVEEDGVAPRQVESLGLPPRLVVRLRAVRRVMRHWPFGASCLRVALVTGQRIRAVHPVLRVGVAKDDKGVRAHAWLEVDGVSLDPSARQEYKLVERAGAKR